MIRRIKFSNFYSFANEQIIDFTSTKKEGYSYYNSKNGDQISKIAVIIGSNASGKTNIMRLLSFLSHFTTRSAITETEKPLSFSYKSFFNNDRSSTFEIVFEVNEKIYTYSLELNKERIINESLSVKEIKKGARPNTVFKRNGDITLYNKYFKGIEESFLDNIREDISLIAYIKSHYSNEKINEVFEYFASFNRNINELGYIYDPGQQVKTLQKYLENDDIKAKMEELISEFDIGVSGFNIKKKALEDNNYQISVQGIHNTEEKNNLLDFAYESRGTQSLFFVLGSLLSALEKGSIAVIDELETGFHPEAVSKLISYFIDENAEGNSQLIVTSHSFSFINNLDMHQIYLTEKNENSVSSCKRLNSIEGVRSDENFLKKYMSGKYGSYPKIMI